MRSVEELLRSRKGNETRQDSWQRKKTQNEPKHRRKTYEGIVRNGHTLRSINGGHGRHGRVWGVYRGSTPIVQQVHVYQVVNLATEGKWRGAAASAQGGGRGVRGTRKGTRRGTRRGWGQQATAHAMTVSRSWSCSIDKPSLPRCKTPRRRRRKQYRIPPSHHPTSWISSTFYRSQRNTQELCPRHPADGLNM